jgi:MFS family permease
MFLVIAELPFYAQSVVGSSATAAGVTLIPMLLGMAVAAFLSGQIMVKFGRARPTAIVGSLVAVAGLVLLARLSNHATAFEAGRASALAGFGIGAANQVYIVSVQNAVARSAIGAASALTHFGRAIGATLGVTTVGLIIGYVLPRGTHLGGHGLGRVGLAASLRDDLANALRLGFWVAAVLEGLAFLVAVFLLEEVTWKPPLDAAP